LFKENVQRYCIFRKSFFDFSRFLGDYLLFLAGTTGWNLDEEEFLHSGGQCAMPGYQYLPGNSS
jgi:hypothetical protein